MDLGLTDKRCVVTGGSRGIGLAVAERLVEEGAWVLLVARDAERLDAAGVRLGCDVLALDVTAPDAAEAVLATGVCDVLVNAAGWDRIDVPTAVVVTQRDKVLPPANQIALARRIPGATIHPIDAGHASCVMESEKFVPALLEAIATVHARRRDFPRRPPLTDPPRSSSETA